MNTDGNTKKSAEEMKTALLSALEDAAGAVRKVETAASILGVLAYAQAFEKLAERIEKDAKQLRDEIEKTCAKDKPAAATCGCSA